MSYQHHHQQQQGGYHGAGHQYNDYYDQHQQQAQAAYQDDNFSPDPQFQAVPVKPRRQPSQLRSNSSPSTGFQPSSSYNEPVPPVPPSLTSGRGHNQAYGDTQLHRGQQVTSPEPYSIDPHWEQNHQPIYDPAPQPGVTLPGHFRADSVSTSVDLGNRSLRDVRNDFRNRSQPDTSYQTASQPAHNMDPAVGYGHPHMQHSNSYGRHPGLDHSSSYGAGYTPEDEKSMYSNSGMHAGFPSNSYDHTSINIAQPSLPPEPNAYGYGYGAQPMPQPHLSSGGLGQPGFVIAPAPMQSYQYQDPNAFAQNRENIMRKRTVKRIPLQNGNLVLDVPVASSISKTDSTAAAEFKEMRYQAVTCDPDDFVHKKYTLRPWLYGRKCEMAIVLTAYNEDDVLFARTMSGVIKNIAHLCTRSRSKTWGADAWQKVVVIIVSDGRKKANERMLKALGLMGCYNEGVMKDHVLNKPVEAHVFEYTTRVQVTEKGEVQVTPCPIQVVFCLKEQNKKKLNSHRWYFNSFCELLQPNVCVLLDVGTKPTGTSIYELWKSFDKHPKVGGACGEICVDSGRGCWQLINPLVASQNFEYKMSNVLDKPTESLFGFISVLPGAFSAYRYKALKGRPLEMYFKGEKLHSGEGGNSIFSGNMYLAEDRILCFELVTKNDAGWLLRYVKSAKAYTDVPDRVPEFISQRRRWLNGSLFASYYATWHWYRIWSSGQSFGRKLVLMLQVFYNLFQLIFSWFAIANFFLAFYFLLTSSTSANGKDPFGGEGEAVSSIFQNVFIAMVIVVLVCSLGNRPQGSNFAYTSAILVFAVIMGLALYAAGYTTYLALDAAGLTTAEGWTLTNFQSLFKVSGFRDIVISLAATYVLYLVASLAHLEPWHMLTSFVQYLFLTPTYIIILSIYSMCNTNDLSWGTKQQTGPATDLGSATSGAKKDGKEVVEVKVTATADDAEELWRHYRQALSVPVKEVKAKRDKATKQEDHARNFRTNLVLIWIGTNALVVIVFTSRWWTRFARRHLQGNPEGPLINPYQSFIFWATAGLAAFRAVGSFGYLLARLFGH